MVGGRWTKYQCHFYDWSQILPSSLWCFSRSAPNNLFMTIYTDLSVKLDGHSLLIHLWCTKLANMSVSVTLQLFYLWITNLSFNGFVAILQMTGFISKWLDGHSLLIYLWYTNMSVKLDEKHSPGGVSDLSKAKF